MIKFILILHFATKLVELMFQYQHPFLIDLIIKNFITFVMILFNSRN